MRSEETGWLGLLGVLPISVRYVMRRLLVPVVAMIGPLLLWPWITRLPPGGIEDDGYFYAGISYYAGVDGRFSFDGIHITDGFHMLWGFLLAAGSFLLSFMTQSRSAHLYLACLASVGVIAFVADRFGRRTGDKVLLLGLGITGTLLMETPLLTLLVLIMVMRKGPEEAASGWQRAPYVLLAMAITITRIDAIIICLIWAGCVLWEGRRQLAASVVLGVFIGAILQLALNHFIAGEWVSVAAQIKTERSVLSLWRFWPPHYLGRDLLLWALMPTSLMAVWRHARATENWQWLFAWLAIAAFTVPHFILGMRPWYFVPAYLGWTTLLVAVRDKGTSSATSLARIGLAACWLGLAAFVVTEVAAGVRYADESRAIKAFIQEVQQTVPVGVPIYQIDGSGYVGFFSERPIVNGDGLVNTHRYAERMKTGKLASYLDEEGINYIISNHADLALPVVDHAGLTISRDEVDELARKRGPVVNRYTNFRLYRLKKAAPTRR